MGVFNMASTDTDPSFEDGNKTSAWEGCCNFLYNKENGTVMGRTGSSWGKIGLFYFVYYTCLTAFFAISLIIFYQTLDDKVPSLYGMESLIKGNPGLSFRPQVKLGSTLIQFEPGKDDTYDTYQANLKAILTKYKTEQEKYSDVYKDCSDINSENFKDVNRTDSKYNCKFDLDLLGNECTNSTGFGFPQGKPCILLKMNKVYGWQ